MCYSFFDSSQRMKSVKVDMKAAMLPGCMSHVPYNIEQGYLSARSVTFLTSSCACDDVS